MTNLLLLGAGKIGRMVAYFLSDSGDYSVTVGDSNQEALQRISAKCQVKTVLLNASDVQELREAMTGQEIVISALSFHQNPQVAQAAAATGCSYFDLTEDIETTRCVREIAQKADSGQVFVPQCGLAPGFVSIVANHLASWFDELDTVHMRVGALPRYPTGALKYNLTWSTDGLVNEYLNPCEVIHNGVRQMVLPLEGLEHFSLDGANFEAFNTSGGLGTLCETLEGQVRELNYKTVRYQGHREAMMFLLNELHLGDNRDLLKELLESAIPITFQDMVVVFCNVTGRRDGQLVKKSDARTIYQTTLNGEVWSAIQLTTAAGICAVVDLFVQGDLRQSGFVRQEEIPLPQFLGNRFGRYYNQTTHSIFDQNSGELL